ncbi:MULTISPECIES: septal ring lytic transglycosylase RlpA family protein [Acidobacteriaceae]|uniref:septal ring lytic transglycosylase RlpA family protein n=1 Tax=Acidobacteriaceae TaxID=204434 RepID=UPI001C2061D4|nr:MULTISPECIES: septal ring lytic transglycosylase RlpA family protein [Acidobacteriaceae]MDW5265053.1 septal ring lytic transglycosylase RlpA family protein [Edaphobacter sp.]
MKLIPSTIRDRKVTLMKGGVVVVTLMMAFGVAASAASDPAPAAKESATQSGHKAKAHHWYQIGEASWYGTRFQGHTTANGEPFNMYALTCAHRSLPLGSWIRVTNLRNHKSIFVRVNDRGPVPEDRVIDLSYAAAKAVGIHGLGKVKLEPVRGGDPKLAQELLAQLQIPVMPNGHYGE